jgi:hypothetical protein
MIASGLVLVIPALLTTILAGGCGVLFASIAWVQLRSGPISKTPVAMFTFAASTAINVVSLPVILCLPYDLQDGYIFGFHAMSFIWSFFLVVSLFWPLQRLGCSQATRAWEGKHSGQARSYSLSCTFSGLSALTPVADVREKL